MYSNSSNNLTGLSSWIFNGTYTPPYRGLYTISFKGADGHTKKNIDFDEWGVTKNSGSIDFGNCRIYTNVNENQISDYDYSCKDDRCIWTFDFSRKVSNLRQYIQCEQPITYLPDSGYPGHLISGINWIDSDNDNGLEVKVSKINDHTYAYDYIGQIDKITTRSIGELNINEKNVTFDVYDYDSSEPIFKTGVCPIQDTPTILLFALLFGFACFLIVMAWVMKIGAMAFFGGLIILISTWFLFACSGILALIIGGFAIYIIAWSFLGISPT